MRWIRANKRIPVDKLKSLHHDRKVYFADETQFQGPYVVISATCTNSHGKKHRFDIEDEGKIFKNDEGKRFFKVTRVRYLLQNIPQSMRFFYKERYAEIMKENLDRITHRLPEIK